MSLTAHLWRSRRLRYARGELPHPILFSNDTHYSLVGIVTSTITSPSISLLLSSFVFLVSSTSCLHCLNSSRVVFTCLSPSTCLHPPYTASSTYSTPQHHPQTRSKAPSRHIKRPKLPRQAQSNSMSWRLEHATMDLTSNPGPKLPSNMNPKHPCLQMNSK